MVAFKLSLVTESDMNKYEISSPGTFSDFANVSNSIAVFAKSFFMLSCLVFSSSILRLMIPFNVSILYGQIDFSSIASSESPSNFEMLLFITILLEDALVMGLEGLLGFVLVSLFNADEAISDR